MTTATTASRKQLVDFLWDWADGHGDWAKLLVSKIVVTELPLSVQDRGEVYDYFLVSLGLKTDLPKLDIKKPQFCASAKKVTLKTISGVAGVNKLAAGQTINFGTNLTVLYGENGSGKTGYGRILKALGYSYDPSVSILGNIEKARENKAAKIEYTVDGTDGEYQWDDTGKDENLSCISVFNNSCVSISLSESRGLLVSPIGFHLFNMVTDELNILSNLHQAEFDKYPLRYDWFEQLHPGTPQEQYISAIKNSSSIPKLEQLAKFTEKEQQLLDAKTEELKNLNKALFETEIASLNVQSIELSQMIGAIAANAVIISKDIWEELVQLDKGIDALEKKASAGLNELGEKNGLQFYQSEEFKKFIKAADQYLKLLNIDEYPDSESKCLYCTQALASEKSRELLASYKSIMNDNSQELIKKAVEAKTKIIETLKRVVSNNRFNTQIFGLDEGGLPSQPEEIVTYNTQLTELREIFFNSKAHAEYIFEFDHNPTLQFLNARKETVDTALEQKKAILATIKEQETKVEGDLNELLDRKLISDKVDAIKKVIDNKGIVSKLISGKTSFNTRGISTKTTQAREELVEQNFENLFQKELKDLRKSSIKVELSFGTTKGQSKLQQRIHNSFSLGEILSEGEQKAIALAEFLTELQLDSSKGPVIFDDPVNSLDHHLIDDVSRRLVKLSQERQVIIFTHSILLFNNLLAETDLPIYKGVLETKFYDVKTEFNVTGYVSENEGKGSSSTTYLKKIKNILQNAKSSGRTEADIAAECFGILRSAIEIGVEHHMFEGVVKRYQKNIALTKLISVRGLKLDEHKVKINEIYERCCGYTNAHSNPETVVGEPRIAELEHDLNTFSDILSEFK
jgi:energy-coupling factor transporter ATP-binding protein EcfA2